MIQTTYERGLNRADRELEYNYTVVRCCLILTEDKFDKINNIVNEYRTVEEDSPMTYIPAYDNANQGTCLSTVVLIIYDKPDKEDGKVKIEKLENV